MRAYDHDQLVAGCVAALGEPDPVAAVAEVVAREVASPAAIQRSVAVPLDPADDGILHRSEDLLVSMVLFPAGFRSGIHDHRVPAVIGAWAGHEDNHLFRRDRTGVAPVGARRLLPGEVLVLGADDVHDVHAPASRWTGAIHVYLGDLAALDRSQWPGPAGPEEPCDAEAMEARWLALASATGLVGTS